MTFFLKAAHGCAGVKHCKEIMNHWPGKQLAMDHRAAYEEKNEWTALRFDTLS